MDTSLLSIALVVCIGGAVIGGAVFLGGMGEDKETIPIPKDGLGTPYDSSGDGGDGGDDWGCQRLRQHIHCHQHPELFQ